MIIGGFGYQVLNGAAFLISSYYSLFANGLGLTHMQVGTCMTMVGIVTTIGYFLGGVLGDIFKAKVLMIISHVGCAITLLFMTTMPSFTVVLVLEFLLGFFTSATYWGGMTRFIKSLGEKQIEGKLYGFFYGFTGLSGTIIGLIVAAMVAKSGNVVGLKLLLTTFAVVNILAATIVLIFYKGYQDKPMDENEKFKMEYFWQVVRMPDVWLVAGITFCAVMIYSVMAYFSPMLEADFGVSAAVITAVVTIRVHFVRLLISPVAGVFVDRFNSPLKVMRIALWLSLVIVAIITAMPWTPTFAWIAIGALLLMSVLFNIATPCWFTTVSEIGIPEKMRATAVGLACAITFSGDIWIYLIGGKLIDSYGSTGYRIYFSMTLLFFVGGLVLSYIAKKRLDKRALVLQAATA